MRQFDFETNIEKRSPFTGNVYMVDRMTSDWAERHPLNVDQFIEDVYQEFAGSEFEESRETLHKVWMATFSMPVHGDASLYPNKNGAHRPASMKVWHMAGDYWRHGLRLGDTLPERCPSAKIIRIDSNGRAIKRYSEADKAGTAWIALFPKDLNLLDGCFDSAAETIEAEDPTAKPAETVVASETSIETEVETEAGATEDDSPFPNDNCSGQTVVVVGTTTVAPEAEAAVAVSQHRTQRIEQEEKKVEMTQQETQRVLSERKAEQRRRRREEREAQRRSYEARMEREAREAEEAARTEERRKIYAAIGAAAVTLVMIYFFGLLGPAVFGLLAGGLLKG